MKYLKRFNESDFHSEVEDCYEDILVIKDILLELTDKEYRCEVDLFINSESGSKYPGISITIAKLGSEQIPGAYQILPLWNDDNDKIDFDAVIIDVFRYAVSQGYKYKSDITYSKVNTDTNTRFYNTRPPLRYEIELYKENNI